MWNREGMSGGEGIDERRSRATVLLCGGGVEEEVVSIVGEGGCLC